MIYFSFRLLNKRLSTETKGGRLINSTSSSTLNKLSIGTANHLSLTKHDSLTSLTSEKVSLMTAAEQSSVVQPLLTDLYQISMAYAYWKANKYQHMATFDLYFRKNRN